MSKHIVVEAFAIEFPPCGLYEFVNRLGCGIANRAPQLKAEHDISFTFLVPKGFKGCFGSNVSYREIPHWQKIPLQYIPSIDCDLYHTPHQLCKLKYIAGRHLHLMTIHDVNFAHTRTGAKLIKAKRRFESRMRHATHLAFISDFAKNDVESRFPFSHPYRIIYNGVTDNSHLPLPELDLASRLPERFLFHLSSLLPYKNAELLLSMMELMPERSLVIAGQWKNNPALLERARNIPNVMVLNQISEEEKSLLFSRCEAFLFPSSAEGFGLPPIEAMKFGKPVFLSTLTSLPEIGGDVAYYWPVLEPQAMADVLADHLTHPISPEKLRHHASQFEWEKCITSYIDYYIDLVK